MNSININQADLFAAINRYVRYGVQFSEARRAVPGDEDLPPLAHWSEFEIFDDDQPIDPQLAAEVTRLITRDIEERLFAQEFATIQRPQREHSRAARVRSAYLSIPTS